MTTLATAANMRAFQLAHPSRLLNTPEGAIAVLGVRCFAVSVNNPEERCSADPGDYSHRMHPDDAASIFAAVYIGDQLARIAEVLETSHGNDGAMETIARALQPFGRALNEGWPIAVSKR